MSNLLKILAVGTKLFHANGQTDMANPIVAFRDFANSPKNRRNGKMSSADPTTVLLRIL
jgi:hypothetical protein